MKARKLAKLVNGRAAAEREPNGRLSRATKVEIDARSPAEVKRLRDAAILGMRDPLWGTELGRLFLRNRITPQQFEAGKRWRSLVECWRRLQGGPSPHEKGGLAPLHTETRGRGMDNANDPATIKRTRELDHELGAALDVLQAGGARQAHLCSSTVRDCCELDRPIIGLAEIAWLQDGTRRARHPLAHPMWLVIGVGGRLMYLDSGRMWLLLALIYLVPAIALGALVGWLVG